MTGHARPRRRFQSRRTPWLSVTIWHGSPPMKLFRHAAVRECHHDVHGIRRYSVTSRPLPRMGHVMLRSLNVSLATALAFLGSLIVPAAAQQQPLRSECLAMANAPPLAVPVNLRRVAAKAEDVAITYVGHSTYYIDTPGGVRIATDFNGAYRTGRSEERRVGKERRPRRQLA